MQQGRKCSASQGDPKVVGFHTPTPHHVCVYVSHPAHLISRYPQEALMILLGYPQDSEELPGLPAVWMDGGISWWPPSIMNGCPRKGCKWDLWVV